MKDRVQLAPMAKPTGIGTSAGVQTGRVRRRMRIEDEKEEEEENEEEENDGARQTGGGPSYR